MEIGKKIKRCRILNDLTQQELADKLFVQRQTISNWETGKTLPRESERALLEELFDTSFNEQDSAKGINEDFTENVHESNQSIEKPDTDPEHDEPYSSFEGDRYPHEKDLSILFLILSIIAVVLFPIGPVLSIYILVKNKKQYSLYLANMIIAVFALLTSSYFLLSMIIGILAWYL